MRPQRLVGLDHMLSAPKEAPHRVRGFSFAVAIPRFGSLHGRAHEREEQESAEAAHHRPDAEGHGC